MDNANRFLDAFALIEKECRQLVGDSRYTKFYLLVQQAAKLNSTIRKHEIDLQEYADLRNAIVHQRTDRGEVIAQPVDWVVEEIERIAQILTQPARLKECFIKPVKTCHPDQRVIDVYRKMMELETSKLPIYQDNEFVGLLTLEMIASWAVLNQKGMPNPTVKEIFKPQYKKEKVFFLSKEATVQEALDLFEKGMRKGVNILAILISAQGRKDEKAEGILTAADLPRLMELAD